MLGRSTEYPDLGGGQEDKTITWAWV